MLFTGDPFLTTLYSQMILTLNSQKVQRTGGAYAFGAPLAFDKIIKNYMKDRPGLKMDPDSDVMYQSPVNSGVGVTRGLLKDGHADGWSTPVHKLHKQPADYIASQAGLVMNAIQRYYDRIYFENIDGTMKDGKYADVAFPLANRHGNYDATNNVLRSITWEDILEIQTSFQEKDVGEDMAFMGGQSLAGFVGFTQPRNILNFLKSDKFINRDFGAMGLVTGTVDSFLGVEFRRTNDPLLIDNTDYYFKEGFASPVAAAATGYEQVSAASSKFIFTTRDALEIGDIAGAGSNAVWQDNYNLGAMRSFTALANWMYRGNDDLVSVFHGPQLGVTSRANITLPKEIANMGIADGTDLFTGVTQRA